MSFPEAFKGAQVELSICKTNGERVSTLLRIARVLTTEAVGALCMVPYGYRAFQLYRSIPAHGKLFENCQHNASIAKSVRYGPQPRSVMDIYVPHEPQQVFQASAQPEVQASSVSGHCVHPGAGYPVALFCHGGVWATGEKWHYAPMATRLAQCGILTCVVSYTLFPQAKAQDMVAELSQALTWTLDNIEKFGGDSGQVSALGHSAGAHMWAMVLLERARATRQSARQRTSHVGQADRRMPVRFIGMAGVYDIAQHLKYEAGRGVRYLSTMERALGGEKEFASQSPTIILAHAAGMTQETGSRESASAGMQAERLGERVAEDNGSAGSGIFMAPSAAAASSAVIQNGNGLRELQQRPCYVPEDLDFSKEDARHLPPWHLYSTEADITVPWIQSSLMENSLQACGVPVQHTHYKEQHVSHASFVTEWEPLSESKPQERDVGGTDVLHSKEAAGKFDSVADLPIFARDAVTAIKERGP